MLFNTGNPLLVTKRLENVRGVRYVAQRFGYTPRWIRHLCDMGYILADKDPDSHLPENRRKWRIYVPSVAAYMKRLD